MDIINAVSNVGFPIAVTAYLLMKFEPTMKANTEAIQDLRTTIQEQLNLNIIQATKC